MTGIGFPAVSPPIPGDPPSLRFAAPGSRRPRRCEGSAGWQRSHPNRSHRWPLGCRSRRRWNRPRTTGSWRLGAAPSPGSAPDARTVPARAPSVSHARLPSRRGSQSPSSLVRSAARSRASRVRSLPRRPPVPHSRPGCGNEPPASGPRASRGAWQATRRVLAAFCAGTASRSLQPPPWVAPAMRAQVRRAPPRRAFGTGRTSSCSIPSARTPADSTSSPCGRTKSGRSRRAARELVRRRRHCLRQLPEVRVEILATRSSGDAPLVSSWKCSVPFLRVGESATDREHRPAEMAASISALVLTPTTAARSGASRSSPLRVPATRYRAEGRPDGHVLERREVEGRATARIGGVRADERADAGNRASARAANRREPASANGTSSGAMKRRSRVEEERFAGSRPTSRQNSSRVRDGCQVNHWSKSCAPVDDHLIAGTPCSPTASRLLASFHTTTCDRAARGRAPCSSGCPSSRRTALTGCRERAASLT